MREGAEDVNRIDMIQSKAPSLAIDHERLRPPGVRQSLHVVAQFANDKRTDQVRLRDNSPRTFEVRARLSKTPPATLDEIRGDFTEHDGASYLSHWGHAGKGAITLRRSGSQIDSFDVHIAEWGKRRPVATDTVVVVAHSPWDRRAH